MMLTLNDGRAELWQWDTGRTLAVDADCSQVHFSNKVFGRSIDVDVAGGTAIIPDVLLQTDKDLNVWAFVGTAENGYTKISKTFKVNRRNKPADYVFTPTDQTTLAELSGRIDRIEESQDPDAIKNAVADYISKNPITVEETDPTVPAWAKEAQKPSYTASEVGADTSGTAEAQVTAHNTAEAAHNDIRLLISGLTDRLNALADSDDTTLDQLSEVVAYIKSNRGLIDAITTSKVSVADIVDNLTTNATNKPLSAAQGVALKALIDGIVIPDKLPNPNVLTFTGAVTGSYDGAEPLTVNIPSSGGGSGGGEAEFPNWRLIKTISFSADIAYVEFDTDDNGNTFSLKEIMLAGTLPAYSGYIYMKPAPTGLQNSAWPNASKDIRWWSASVNGKLKTMLAVSNASVIWAVDKDPVCENDTISRLVIGASGGFTADGTMYVYGR